MKWLRALLVIVGAGIGAFCGWLNAKGDHDFSHVGLGALFGGFIGYWIAELIED